MRRLGLLPALLLAAAVHQTAIPDDGGIFLIRRAGAPFGTEKFSVTRLAGTGGATYQLKATRFLPTRRIVTSLQTDSLGGPTSYMRISPGDSVTRLTARLNGRLLTVRTSGSGFHNDDDYPLKRGTLLIDDDLIHQLSLIFVTDSDHPISYVSPATGVDTTASLVDMGPEEVILGNKSSLPGHHFIFGTGAETRDIWIDSNKRLLKVSIPGRQIEALRDGPPP
jgi:hypothetical protein